jgi:hypothetical protein
MKIYISKKDMGISPGVSYSGRLPSLVLRYSSRKAADKAAVSIMVNDQGSTVPKARGEKIRMKINIIKILLDILYN